MSGQWTCAFCGGPVALTPKGKPKKHGMWRQGQGGPYQTGEVCGGTAAIPPPLPPARDMRDVLAEVVAERFGSGRRR